MTAPAEQQEKLWTTRKTKDSIEILVGDGKALKFGFPLEQSAVVELLVVAHNATLSAHLPILSECPSRETFSAK